MWKIVFYQRIRADAHPASTLALAYMLPSAVAFLANHVSWSGNSTGYAHPHSLQRNNKFSSRRFLKSFYPCAPKHDRKIRVANSSISRYLLSITAFCAPTALHLIFIPPTGQYMVEKIRLFSYFPDPVALLKSENPARFSRSILAL